MNIVFPQTQCDAKAPEGINSDQGCLQVDRLVGLSVSGKDNPLAKLVEGLDVDSVGLPEHLHLVPIPRFVNCYCEVEKKTNGISKDKRTVRNFPKTNGSVGF